MCPPAQAQFFGRTGLPDAVRFGIIMEMGDVDQAREWLEQGLSPDFVADRIGTGLMIAARESNLAMMELFVARGADVNMTNALGEDALMHAAWRGKLEAVQWLAAHGARINRGPKQWTALHYAAFAGHEVVARYLVARGADINARSTNGSSVLMMAVYEGREPVVRQLLALGADRSAKNEYGEGALEWAFKHKHLTIARLVGDAQEFAAAANRPKAEWAEPLRSVAVAPAPVREVEMVAAPGEIEELLRIRAVLVSRDATMSVDRLDRKIAALRARRAKPDLDTPRTILEISASRAAPREQKFHLIVEPRSQR